jgi:hypothetical protein
MDLLLAHAFFLAEDAEERRIMRPYPPLGILYLSAHLKARGFDVGVFDGTFQSLSDFSELLVAWRPHQCRSDRRGRSDARGTRSRAAARRRSQ